MNELERIKKAKSNVYKKKFYNDSRKIKNFCKNYKVGGALKCKSFNKEWNDKKKRHVFYPSNDFTEEFYKEIEWRVTHRKNLVLALFGETGSGKSLVSQTIGKDWVTTFNEKLKEGHLHNSIPKEIMKKLISNGGANYGFSFSDPEFLEHISKMEYGHIEIRDESPRISGKGKHGTIDAILNILDEVRAHQNSFIIVSPDLNQLTRTSVVHFYLRTAGINYKERKTRLIVYEPIMTHGGSVIIHPTGRIKLKIHNDKKLIKHYDRLKDKNINKIKATQGKVGKQGYGNADGNKEQLKELIRLCEKNNWTSKVDIRRLGIEVFNRVMKEKGRNDMIIGGLIDDVENIVHWVAQHFKDKDKEDSTDVIKKYVNKELGKKNVVKADEELIQKVIKEEKENWENENKKRTKKKTQKKPKNKKEKNLKNKEKYGNHENHIIEKILEDFKFEYTEEDIENVIIRNARNQHNTKEYLEIYHICTSTNRILEDIGKEFDLSIGRISQIKTSMTNKISTYKGQLFEEEVLKHIKSYKYFGHVRRDGSAGKPDIVVDDLKNNYLYVLSLKNHAVGEDNYTYVKIKEISPEIEYARENHWDYEKVFVKLVFFDNISRKIIIKDINYEKPKKIKIKF